MLKSIISAAKMFILVAVLTLGVIYVQAEWNEPTAVPPGDNTDAPVNVGSTDQVKSAGLGLNSLAVFGNAIMSGASRYLNFGNTSGSSGYGFRDNAGTMEFKNSGGAWAALGSGGGGGSLDCTTVTAGSGSGTVNCPAGYTVTGGACYFMYYGYQAQWNSLNSQIAANGYSCTGESVQSKQARCCRIN